MSRRAALLIRCSLYEAQQVRNRAAAERRTVSGYLLNILERQIKIEGNLMVHLGPRLSLAQPEPERFGRGSERRTAILLRCSTEEASIIRAAAARRRTAINGFVLMALRLTWKVAPEPKSIQHFAQGTAGPAAAQDGNPRKHARKTPSPKDAAGKKTVPF